jgi:hypothetical protein
MLQNNKATGFLYKVTVITFIFGVFPVILLVLIDNYTRYAKGEVAENIIQREIALKAVEDGRVMSQAEATTLRRINESIAGIWINERDEENLLEIGQNNTFAEYEDGEKKGFGTWRIYSAVLSPVGAASSTSANSSSANEPTYHMQRTRYETAGNEKKNYVIKKFDGTSLVLSEEGTRSEASYRKSISAGGGDIQ